MNVISYRRLLIDLVKKYANPTAKVYCTCPYMDIRTHRVDGRVMFTYETNATVYVKGDITKLDYSKVYTAWHKQVQKDLIGVIETDFRMEISESELPPKSRTRNGDESELEKSHDEYRSPSIVVNIKKPFTIVFFRVNIAHDLNPPVAQSVEERIIPLGRLNAINQPPDAPRAIENDTEALVRILRERTEGNERATTQAPTSFRSGTLRGSRRNRRASNG
jgi:hypothetical protein